MNVTWVAERSPPQSSAIPSPLQTTDSACYNLRIDDIVSGSDNAHQGPASSPSVAHKVCLRRCAVRLSQIKLSSTLPRAGYFEARLPLISSLAYTGSSKWTKVPESGAGKNPCVPVCMHVPGIEGGPSAANPSAASHSARCHTSGTGDILSWMKCPRILRAVSE